MDRPSLATFSALLFASTLFACGSAPPPPPATPEPVKVEEPKEEAPPPPPPPKCESLDEKCAAAADTRLSVGASSFQPPLGWSYAKESGRIIAVAPGDDGVLVMAESDGADPAKTLVVVKALLDKLGVSEVKLPKLEKRLKKPQSSIDASGISVGLWEIDKAQQGSDPKRGDKVGALLVVIAPSGGKAMVGVSFVPKGAPSDRAAAIVDSVKSIRGGG